VASESPLGLGYPPAQISVGGAQVHYTVGSRRLALLLVSSAGGLTAVTATAQTSDEGLQEVVVTATKQEQPLSKVPISIAAYTAETMDREGVRSIDDIVQMTPGLTLSRDSFGGGTSTNISIRGISSDSGAATTGIYIDDVPIQIRTNPQTAFGTSFPQVFDLERIEVLRGPQGTLFGAGAEGGAVRFITPTPSFSRTNVYARSEVASTYHGGLSYEAGAAGGTPLIDQTLAVQASAWYREGGGYLDRQPHNTSDLGAPIYHDVNRSDVMAFRGALAYKATANMVITPSVFYQRWSLHDTGNFWGTLSDPADHNFVSGNVLRQPASDRFVLPSLKLEADFGALRLTSISGYFDRKAQATQDYTNLDTAFIGGVIPPYPFLPGQNAPGTIGAQQQDFTQEVRLNSTDATARIKWTAGLFYSRSRQTESFSIQDLFAQQMLPVPIELIFGEGLSDGRYLFLAYNNTLEKQLAAFGQADVKLTDQLSATLGLRYSKSTLDFARTLGGPLNYPQDGGPDLRTTQGTQTSKPVTPKVGINYQVNDDNLVYASAGKGFRVGGVNPPLFVGCTNLTVPTTFGPDSTWSYEIGSKNRLFDGALRLQESLFYIRWSDIQQFVSPGGACAGNGFRDNLGQAVSKGFDLQAEGRVTHNLTLSAAIGYVDAAFSKTVSVTDPITGNPDVFVSRGDTLAGPPWQLTGAVDYTFNAFDEREGYVHLEERYSSHNDGRKASLDDPNAVGYDPTLRMDPAVSQLNLRFGARQGGLDASLFVNNVFDKTPLLNISHDTANSPLFYYNSVRPRTIGITVTYRH